MFLFSNSYHIPNTVIQPIMSESNHFYVLQLKQLAVIRIIVDLIRNVEYQTMAENLSVFAYPDLDHCLHPFLDVNPILFNSAFLDPVVLMQIAQSPLWEKIANVNLDILAIHSLVAYLLQYQLILVILLLVERILFARLIKESSRLYVLAFLE